MPIPIATVGLVVSAVRSLIRLRGRVDEITSLSVATEELPFALPPLPQEAPAVEKQAVVLFFETAVGRRLTETFELSEDLDSYRTNVIADEDVRDRLEAIYLRYLGAEERAGDDGPARDIEQKLVNFVLVDSYRLSRNSAVLNIALASADTLLEFVGDNAATFVSNPKTAGILETILAEFAGRRDFEDASGDLIFRTLLGSAAVAAVEHKGDLPDHPALLVLYAALGKVRNDMGQKGDDFVAKIITADGFNAVVSRYLTTAASDPGFLKIMAEFAGTTNLDAEARDIIRGAFVSTLETIGENPTSFLSDPDALSGVLEAAISGAAANASPLIRKLGDGKPVMGAVLEDVVRKIGERGADGLFASLSTGELVGEFYKTALAAVAANPDLDRDGVTDIVEKIVGGLADELAKSELSAVITEMHDKHGLPVANRLLARTLTVLAEEPAIIAGGDSEFSMAVVGAVLAAAAPLVRDGLEEEDVWEIIRIATHSAAINTSSLGLDAPLSAALSAFGTSIAAKGDLRKRLSSRESRRNAFLTAIHAVAASPRVWATFDESALVKPVVEAVISGLRDDPTNVLTGAAMVDALKSVFDALASRGLKLAEDLKTANEGGVDAASLADSIISGLVTRALTAASGEIGKSIAREQVPEFLKRVLTVALKNGKDAVGDVVDQAIANVTDQFGREGQ